MPELTTDQIGELAADFLKFGNILLQYKLNNEEALSDSEDQSLRNLINSIVHTSNLLAALATYDTAEDIASSLIQLKKSTDKINEALKRIKNIQDGINIATLIINIGTSVLSNDAHGFLEGVTKLNQRINDTLSSGT